MKMARIELQKAIENKERIFFDGVPIDYNEENNQTINVCQKNELGDLVDVPMHVTQSPNFKSKWLQIA